MLTVGPSGSGGGGGGVTDIVAGPGILVTGGTGPVATITSLITLYPPVSEAVPSAAGNLTLSLEARGNVGLASVPAGSGDNTVLQWDNGARPGFYWTPASATTGNTALWNPSNAAVGGNPTVDFTEIPDATQGSYILGVSEGSVLTSIQSFLFLQQWTIGAAVLYTGAAAFNPGLFIAVPTILVGQGNNGPGLVCGLSAGNLVFGLWYVDHTGTTRYVESSPVVAGVPHYVIGTFSNGILSIQVDGGAAVPAGPFPLMAYGVYTGTQIAAWGDDSNELAEFVGSAVDLHAWNRALTPTEITQLSAYYAAALA
jgi:Concanavalin A-like lectin/glucanases superfamily